MQVFSIKYEFSLNMLGGHMLCVRHYSIFYKEFKKIRCSHCPSGGKVEKQKNSQTTKNEGKIQVTQGRCDRVTGGF